MEINEIKGSSLGMRNVKALREAKDPAAVILSIEINLLVENFPLT